MTDAAIDNRPTGARLLVDTLEKLGVDTLFGYPGGAIMPVYDALTQSNLRHILVRHEQGATFAADAYARVTGKVGVCMATSGPGATNLVTGLANAMLDSIPMVAITGQVASHLMGTDGFQEIDILGITLPIVKHSYVVRDPAEIPRVLEEAFYIASEGRPGPVLVDLPKDVIAGRAHGANPFTPKTSVKKAPAATLLQDAKAMIEAAKKPLLYLGGGVVLAGAVLAARRFAHRTQIPAVQTLKGLGVLPTDHPLNLGMLGMHGTPGANHAIQEADLLIVCGARFDDRATGRLDQFAPNAKVIHFDADASEISKLRRADLGSNADLGLILEQLDVHPVNITGWRDACVARAKAGLPRYDFPGENVYAPRLLKRLSEAAGDEFIAACDVGQNQMWVAQHCRFAQPESHITSAGLGAMGFGLPAGIGAQLARPHDTVVVVAGDGGFMMNIQELATVKRYQIPLKILLLDNARLGMVRQWQELFYDKNFSEVDLSDNPDFVQVAQAFGIEAFRVDRADQEEAAIKRLLSARGPILAHVVIDPNENVWPLVPPGKNNSEMMEGASW